MSAEANQALIRRYFEAGNGGDVTALDALLVDGYVTHTPVRGFAPDREGTKQSLVAVRAAFPDGRNRLEDVLAVGDRVVGRWSWRATHQGELLGIAPTGKQVTMNGITILRVAEGRIAEEWEHRDALGLLRQLGLYPAVVAT